MCCQCLVDTQHNQWLTHCHCFPQAAQGFDLDTSMFLIPSMDLDKITTPYIGDGCGDETSGEHPSAAGTPASSLDLGKLSATSMLLAGF